MIFLAALWVVSILYLLLGAAIWWKTRNLAFFLGLAFVYYWTYYGAWFIVTDRLRGYSTLRYEYLYAKLFPVHLDDAYLWTLTVYGLFMLSIELAVLALVPKRQVSFASLNRVHISHNIMLAIGTLSGLVSFLAIRGSIAAASDMNVSGYEFIRLDDSAAGMYTVHQLLMRLSLFSATTGLAVYLSGVRPRLVTGARSLWILPTYFLLLGGLFALNMRLGQRRELAAASIAAGLFYLVNVRRPNWLLLVGSGAVMAIVMGLVSMTRGTSLAAGTSPVDALKDALTENLLSNEPFAAHLSLYGSIEYKLPPTYGSSLVYLASSVVPGATRPKDIYGYYAEGVRAIEGQGYNVHHAAAWYLNFGVFGAVAGGALLGCWWAALYALFQNVRTLKFHLLQVFALFTVWNFTAFLPSICRDGPEGYKGLLIDVVFIPMFALVLATIRPVMRAGRPTLVPTRIRAGAWSSAQAI